MYVPHATIHATCMVEVANRISTTRGNKVAVHYILKSSLHHATCGPLLEKHKARQRKRLSSHSIILLSYRQASSQKTGFIRRAAGDQLYKHCRCFCSVLLHFSRTMLLEPLSAMSLHIVEQSHTLIARRAVSSTPQPG